MTLIVEDGTIVAGANALVSVADWDAYWTARDRGDLVDDIELTAKQAAILFSTRDLLARYRWRGRIVDLERQDLPFPRYSLVDDEGRNYTYPASSSAEGRSIPRRLTEACMELGAAHIDTALNTALGQDGGEVKTERIGPLLTTYFDSVATGRDFPYIERIVVGLHDGKAGSGRISYPILIA